MASPGPEKAIVHQHCLVQQELSGMSREGGYRKGQGKERPAPPQKACILEQVAVRDRQTEPSRFLVMEALVSLIVG